MILDFLGKEIKLGSNVVFFDTEKRVPRKGIVMKFNKETATISCEEVAFGKTVREFQRIIVID